MLSSTRLLLTTLLLRLYYSMDEISATTCVMEAESYNPVYEGLVVVFVFLRRFSFLD